MSDPRASAAFEDFDLKPIFEKCDEAVLSVDTQNFILEFNNISAKCALDVDLHGIHQILATERLRDAGTRWINIWSPETQKDSLTALAEHYGFSPRLLGLMRCDPLRPIPVPTTTHHSRVSELWNRNQDHQGNHETGKNLEYRVADLEGHLEKSDSRSRRTGPLDLNHYRMVNEVWHYSSVDWGHKFLCIGYNSLYHTRADLSRDFKSSRRGESRPAGKRVWAWLVLCDDGTVISIHENPYPNHVGPLNDEEQEDLENLRRNLRNVFGQISFANETSKSHNPIMSLPIRSPANDNNDSAHSSASEVPSLLFYYLFDDWHTSYSLVARSEHQYGAQLEHVRERMFKVAELNIVDELHHYGRQLAVLKRMYTTYENIVQRVLEGPKEEENLMASASGSRRGSNPQVFRQTEAQTLTLSGATGHPSYGVPLATAAKLKFVRLRDRINLYCLSEVQDCLDEKEALVFLNFNLIQLKEASAVERLTRITILLAKVTILFLPVSLMTAYFSIQVMDLQGVYTHVTYWVCFAVITTFSIIFLLVFGKLSGTQEGKPIYRSLTRVFYDKSKALYDSKTTASRAGMR